MARGRKSSLVVSLSIEQREALEGLLRKTTVRAGIVRRARIILLCAEGTTFADIARAVGVQRRIARLWARRYIKEGLDGLKDRPRSGRPPAFSPGSRGASGQAGVRAAG
jgi:hypothetical protein